MRLAIHSISWGEHISIDRLLFDVKNAGYSGVELFQHPESLGTPAEVYAKFCKYGLQLVGMCGGCFSERVDFIRDYATAMGKPLADMSVPYAYLDGRVENEVIQAMNAGIRVGLHTHMYKPVQTLNEAALTLELYPRLRFVPDTAHLTIAGDDPVQAIERFASRIDVCHLKDWQGNVGRSYHFYARGFCQLGSGDLNPKLEQVLSAVVRRAFHIWLVIEQDWTNEPLKDARESFEWLRSKLPR
jgi:sugar phosphate isomerase/epimerase